MTAVVQKLPCVKQTDFPELPVLSPDMELTAKAHLYCGDHVELAACVIIEICALSDPPLWRPVSLSELAARIRKHPKFTSIAEQQIVSLGISSLAWTYCDISVVTFENETFIIPQPSLARKILLGAAALLPS